MSEANNDRELEISVDEIQQTIRMDILAGKVKEEALPPFPNRLPSFRATRSGTGFFRSGLLHLRYFFGYPESSNILIHGSESNDSDTLTAMKEGKDLAVENHEFGRVEELFERESLIASGGQADIINGKDKQIGRTVAIKRLREDCKASASAKANLMQEALLTASLEHPAIIPVHCLCCDQDKNLHIVMKKIRGKTLGKYLDEVRDYYEKNGIHIFEERASLARRLDIFLDVCNGLSYAHSLRVLHCDLKPDNVMIGFHRETYIIDWGIAKTLNDDDKVAGLRQIAGTPRYIAPEVALGMDYDQRADIFSMGSILFELVTLKEAFSGDSLKEILENICCGKMLPVKHLFGLGIDKGLVYIIEKATATNPDLRYRNINDLAEDIRRYRSGLEIMAKPDNLLQHAVRWMLIHKRLTRWAFQVFLVLILGLVGCNVYTKMQYELAQKRRETSLNNAYTKSLIVTTEINNQLNKMEQIVSVLASETAFILDHHPFEPGSEDIGQTPRFVSFRELGSDTPPKSSIRSLHYNSRIDFSNLSYANAGKILQQELDYYCYTLLPFRRQIIGFFILSNNDKAPFIGEEAYLPENMAKSNYSLLWLYLNFANGLQLCYPATESHDDQGDFRKRSWYTKAEKHPDEVVWEGPYLDSGSGGKVVLTAAKGIVTPKPRFLGVACADIALEEISRIISQDQSDKYFKKMLLLNDGSILINTANPLSRPKNDKNGQLVLAKFHNKKLFEIMQKKKFGFVSVPENGRETFYIYSYLEQMQWYYVVRIDQDTIHYQDDWKSAK